MCLSVATCLVPTRMKWSTAQILLNGLASISIPFTLWKTGDLLLLICFGHETLGGLDCVINALGARLQHNGRHAGQSWNPIPIKIHLVYQDSSRFYKLYLN